ncbi:MAG: EAL domain-containing protein [Actinomycetota bacterium]|nr:EAL domain-containing protein [Actinomycetota bacterium]
MPAIPSVLLVEDNPADARLIQEMVASSGEHDLVLRPCRKLSEAITAIESDTTDCVLLDLSLPDVNGLDGIYRLRERFPGLPIVILTGLNDEDVALEALQAGAQDFLVKGSIEGNGVKRAVRYAIERKSAEEELARLGRQNEMILDSAGDGICGLDAAGVVTFANPAAGKLLGCPREELLGTRLHDVVHPKGPLSDGHDSTDCPIQIAVSDGTSYHSDDETFSRCDSTPFPVEYAVTPYAAGPGQGVVVTFKDITERKRAEQQLQYLADHDVLTGLFNRRRFGEELAQQIAVCDRLDVESALLVLDIDNFKFINDALGHHAGDELIRSLSSQLKCRVRRTDIVARLGGDEFAMLLTGTNADDAIELAEELLTMARGHRVLARDKPVQITSSIGIAMIDAPDLTAEQLLMEADVAMYEAKGSGRDRVVLFTRDTPSSTAQRAGFVWTDRIKKALRDDLFAVYAQPIASLGEGDADRYELLIRMKDEDGNIVPPGAFLPVAERFGLIAEIDVWMIRQAINLIEREQAEGRDIVVEVNLSGHSICDPELPDLIEAELEKSPIDPAQLVFEITETAAIANMDEARTLATRIHRWGCRFALDDFGAGFGSFYYLKYLPVDYLKIDGEFIRNLDSSEIDQRMVQAMVEISRALGLRTIAEFVENEEILTKLRSSNVDFVQGYHVGRPAPVEELAPIAL